MSENYQEKWKELRSRSRIMGKEALEDAFLDWSEDFVSARQDIFTGWRTFDRRRECLRQLLGGEVAVLGNGPQQEAIYLASLFHVLTFGRCLIVSFVRMELDLFNKVRACFGDLEGVTVGDCSSITGEVKNLAEISSGSVVLVDYFVFVRAIQQKPQDFPDGLPVLMPEVDLCLYTNRLVFLEKNLLRCAGMIYNAPKYPRRDWADEPSVLDVPEMMRRLNFVLGGSCSYIDRQTCSQLAVQAKAFFKKAPKCNFKFKASVFPFRTQEVMLRELVKDVLKCSENTFVFCARREIGEYLKEEFAKSGQDCSIARDNFTVQDALENKPGRHVFIMLTTCFTMCPQVADKKPCSMFFAELPISESFCIKAWAGIGRLATPAQAPRLYFSLEDRLMQIYEEQGNFDKMFALMDFTEKYDPFRQIRRVVGKLIVSRLAGIRERTLDDTQPIVVSSVHMDALVSSAFRTKKALKTAQRMEALCFCGSGKPFKDCHGRKNK